MNGINTNFGSERLYSGKSNAASYANDGAFSSLISEAQKSSDSSETDFDFSDMYVRTYQHSLEDAMKDLSAAWRPWGNEKYLQVPVAGDMKELMESIEKGIADGESLRNILQNRIDRYAKECGEDGVVAVGGSHADLILIDPDTGKVIDSHPKTRCLVWSKKVQDSDYSTVRSEADDLATFLRYTVFKKETDAPEKVSALLSELKEKQSGYDTSRFLPIFSSVGDRGWENAKYLIKLLGLDDDDDELNEDGRDEIADELIRIVGERFSSNGSKNDALHEEMEKMKFENAGKLNIKRRAAMELLKIY